MVRGRDWERRGGHQAAHAGSQAIVNSDDQTALHGIRDSQL